MKTIAITGVAGFIGSNLATMLLSEGYNVVGIDNLSYGLLEQVPKEVDFIKLVKILGLDNHKIVLNFLPFE